MKTQPAFEVHPILTQAALRLGSLKPDQFELYLIRKYSTKIDSKNQETDSLTRSEDVGLSIRVVQDHRRGFSFTTSLDPLSMERAIDSALETSKLMPQDEYAELYSFDQVQYPSLDLLDTRGLKAPLEEKIALAKQLESECRKFDSRITGVRAASFIENYFEIQMMDSHQNLIRQEGSLFTAQITCKAEENGDSQLGFEMGFSNTLDQIRVPEIGSKAAQSALELLGAGSPPTLKCPAVIRNSTVSELIDFLSSSFSAEEIDKGRSMLSGFFGQTVFPKYLNLIDDGLLKDGYCTSQFDGEGVPSKKTYLIREGQLKEPLSNLYYSKKNKLSLTGNSSRGIKSPPSIQISNLYLKPGLKTLSQLYDGISQGILITDLMGMHTANPVTGDFSLGASGILIEKGKLTRPVKGFAVAGNIIDLFKNITDLGNDLKFSGNVGAPSIRIGEISVGGTS